MEHPIKNPNFRTYLVARLFGALGSYMMEVALMWWALETTGRNDSVAWVALTMSLVGLLVAPFGGVMADRGSKVKMSSRGYMLSTVAPAISAGLLYLGYLSYPLVIAIVAFDNLVSSFFAPSTSALGPLLLAKEQYAQGAALAQGMSKFLRMVSMPLGGVLVGSVGVAATLIVTVSTYILAAVIIRFVAEPAGEDGATNAQPVVKEQGGEAGQPDTIRGRWLEPILVVLRMLFTTPVLFAAIVMVGLLNLILSPIGAMMAPFAKSLGEGPGAYGTLMAGVTAGELAGFALFSVFRSPRALPVIFGGSLAIALGMGLLAMAHSMILAVAGLALSGFSAVALGVHLDALAVQWIPRESMGRAMSLIGMLVNGLGPLGIVFAGLALKTLPFSYIFGGIALLVMLASLMWLWPPIAKAIREAEVAIAEEVLAQDAA